MQNYVDHMRRRPIEKFADGNWRRMCASERLKALTDVEYDFSKLIGIQPPVIIPVGSLSGYNAQYYKQYENYGEKISNVILISQQALTTNTLWRPVARHKFITHPGAAMLCSLIHECVHAHDHKYLDLDARGIKKFDYLDISDVPCSNEQLRASVSTVKIRTHIDSRKIPMSMYASTKPDDAAHNRFKWAMYVFNPFEWSARTASDNFLKQCISIWKHCDKPMNLSYDEVENISGCDPDLMIDEAKYVIRRVGYDNAEELEKKVEDEWPDSIDKMFNEFGKVYANEPDQDPMLAGLVRMTLREQVGRVPGMQMTGLFSVQDETELVKKELKHRKQFSLFSSHDRKMNLLNESSISDIGKSDAGKGVEYGDD